MAWWFAAPLVVWGAKKIYDAVTEEDEPSYGSSSNSSSTVASAKSNRTRARKRLVQELILENREKLVSENLYDLTSKGIVFDGSIKTSVLLDTEEQKLELHKLNETIKLLNSSFSITFEEGSDLHLFSNIEETTAEAVKKANEQYGDMSGINSFNKYDEALDPFVIHLQSKHL